MKRRTFLRTAALCLMLFVTLSLTAFAVTIPKPTTDFYVNDFAGVLSQSTKDAIIAKNDQLQRETGAQIVVTIVEDAGGLSMEDLAYKMFNEWSIGDADKNNGVLLLLSIGDDDYHCLQGEGLERLLPTSTLSRILQEDLEPDFAAKDYDAGVYKTFYSLYDEVDSIYVNGEPVDDYDGGRSVLGGFLLLLLLTLIVIPLLARVMRAWILRHPYGSGFASGYAAGRRSSSYYRPRSSSYRSSSYRSSSHRSSSSRSSHSRSGGGGSSRGGGAGRGH